MKVHRNVKTKMAYLGIFLSSLFWRSMSQYILSDPQGEKREAICIMNDSYSKDFFLVEG